MAVRGPLATPRLTALARLTDMAESFRCNAPQEPVLYHSGDDFRDLFSLSTLDDMLSFGGRRRPDFRVIRNGVQVPDSRYTRANLMYPGIPDSRKIAHELANGSTIVMQGVQEYHEPLGAFARKLAHDLSRPVHVNAYVTPGGAQGFGSHFDPQDAFIIQVEGSKDWTLREPALARPLAHESWDHLRQRPGWDVARIERAAPWRQLTLRPGDCLWLPRGWVHSARSGQVMSLHLTLSFATWTGHWAALELLARVAEGSAREDLPADLISDPDCAAAVAARIRADLATWFEQVPDAELGEILRAAAMREFPEAPCQVVAGDEVSQEQEFTVHPETVFAAVEREDGLTLHLAGHVVTLPAAAAPVCAAILGRDRFSLKDLHAGHEPALCADVVRLLRDEGIIDGRHA